LECQSTDSILDWSGYIDQGKQLSILHSLLVENFPKLPQQKQNEMSHLTTILDHISQIKESTENNYQRHLTEQSFASMDKLNGHKSSMTSLQAVSNQTPSERGIMRGVLTPNSLQKNIVSCPPTTLFFFF
jgi:RAS protein activator-like 2